MHQLTSLQSYFYACNVPSKLIKLSFFSTKNPVDVRREVVQKQEIFSACQAWSAEHSGAVIFSLSISFLCVLLTGYFSGLAAYFPPSLFVPLRYYYSTHNNNVRPPHRCLPPLRRCCRHPLPSVPPAAYCVTVAAIGPPLLPSPSLEPHRYSDS